HPHERKKKKKNRLPAHSAKHAFPRRPGARPLRRLRQLEDRSGHDGSRHGAHRCDRRAGRMKRLACATVGLLAAIGCHAAEPWEFALTAYPTQVRGGTHSTSAIATAD